MRNACILFAAAVCGVLMPCVGVLAGGHGRDTAKHYDIRHNIRLPVQYAAGVPGVPNVWAVTDGETTAQNLPTPPVGAPHPDGPVNGVFPHPRWPAVGFLPPAGGAHIDDAMPDPVVAHNSTADAHASYSVQPFGAGANWIVGSYRVWGTADAKAHAPGAAGAWSSASLHAVGVAQLPNGALTFGPEKMSSISGGARQRARDPLSLTLTDPQTSAVLFSGDLLDVVFDLTDGGYNWENGQLSVDAWDAKFSILVPGTLTHERGNLELVLADGAVKSAQATGIFSNIQLPPIGETGSFSVSLPNMMDFNLNLPGLDPEKEYGFDWGMLSLGEAADAIVPEPSIAALGLIGVAVLASRRRLRIARGCATMNGEATSHHGKP